MAYDIIPKENLQYIFTKLKGEFDKTAKINDEESTYTSAYSSKQVDLLLTYKMNKDAITIADYDKLEESISSLFNDNKEV